MKDKKFNVKVKGIDVKITAEKEGDARYMVRMSKADSGLLRVGVRIGYLTGNQRKWVGESSRGACLTVPSDSAQEVCKKLAELALGSVFV